MKTLMEQKNSVTPFGLTTQALEHKRNNLEGREISCLLSQV